MGPKGVFGDKTIRTDRQAFAVGRKRQIGPAEGKVIHQRCVAQGIRHLPGAFIVLVTGQWPEIVGSAFYFVGALCANKIVLVREEEKLGPIVFRTSLVKNMGQRIISGPDGMVVIVLSPSTRVMVM